MRASGNRDTRATTQRFYDLFRCSQVFSVRVKGAANVGNQVQANNGLIERSKQRMNPIMSRKVKRRMFVSINKQFVLCSIPVSGGILPVHAHHSFPATYFVDQSITIDGTVVQFLFRNPHSFVHVMAPDKDGVMQRWAVEWGAGGSLASDNISSDTLKPGDKVVIKGSPARNTTDHRLRMSSIERMSDHWKWSGTFG